MEFNKASWIQKTSEYMDYIAQHRENVVRAWNELRKALTGYELFKKPEIMDAMLWRVRNHDDSKLSVEEFLPYRQRFYPLPDEEVDEQAFRIAWKVHYGRNDHHWEHWVHEDGFVTGYDVNERICACLEMICDWQAMGYVFGDNAPTYYKNHKTEMRIDPNWVGFVEEVLGIFEEHLNGSAEYESKSA